MEEIHEEVWRPSLGNALCATRTMSGVTQGELAQRSTVHRTAITRAESGRVDPQWSTVCRLFHALGFELELAPLPPDTRGATTNEATVVIARAQVVRPPSVPLDRPDG